MGGSFGGRQPNHMKVAGCAHLAPGMDDMPFGIVRRRRFDSIDFARRGPHWFLVSHARACQPRKTGLRCCRHRPEAAPRSKTMPWRWISAIDSAARSVAARGSNVETAAIRSLSIDRWGRTIRRDATRVRWKAGGQGACTVIGGSNGACRKHHYKTRTCKKRSITAAC